MRRLVMLAEALRGRLLQLRALVNRGAANRELAEEFAHHVALETEANLERGMAPAEARRAALRAFGGVERFGERVREGRWTRWFEETLQDVRYGARGLRRRPGFTAAAVVTLALGIGANAALFALLQSVVHRMPAGVPASDDLVRVSNEGRMAGFAPADLREVAAHAEDVVTVAAWSGSAMALGSGGDPVRVAGELVSGPYFQVLGLRPVHGRFFRPDEDQVPGRDAVVVLGHGLWQARFGGREEIVGSAILLNGHPFTVVGVAPPGFGGLELEQRAELWVPYMAQPLAMPRSYDVLQARDFPIVTAVGRLAPGQSTEAATVALQVAAARLPAVKRFEPVRPVATTLRGWMEPEALASGAPILAFAAMLTGLLLLICCANVANLQLSRALGRSREVALRLALGAGRGRLVRLLVAESVLLAVFAGALGVAVAYLLAVALRSPFGGPLAALDITPDGAGLLFTFVLALGAGIVAGLTPALRAARPDVMPALKTGGGSVDRDGGRIRGVLVVGQVAISLVLLVAAGLFLSRLGELHRVDPGFDAERTVAFSVDVHAHGYDRERRTAFFEELQRRIEAIPGVAAAAAPTAVPLAPGGALVLVSSAGGTGAESPTGAAGGPTGGEAAPAAATVRALALGVPADYFRVLQVEAERGRTFSEADEATGGEPVVVISSAVARRLWPEREAVGQRLTMGRQELRVVGVVRELAHGHMAEPDPYQIYVPPFRGFHVATDHVLIRTHGDPAPLLPRLRSEVQRLDPALPLFDLHILGNRMREQLAAQRALTRVVGAFGLVALLLALVGVYGIVSAAVAARGREIGVRLALGARPEEVTRLFLGRGVRLGAYGLLAGAALALPVGRLISSIVWGVDPWEPLPLLLAALSLLVASALASWLPARRAARVDPARTLRTE